jgi:hypothetical protein
MGLTQRTSDMPDIADRIMKLFSEAMKDMKSMLQSRPNTRETAQRGRQKSMQPRSQRRNSTHPGRNGAFGSTLLQGCRTALSTSRTAQPVLRR